MIVGLTESADDFPAPPVPAADLKTALDSYLTTRDKASSAGYTGSIEFGAAVSPEARGALDSGQSRSFALDPTDFDVFR